MKEITENQKKKIYSLINQLVMCKDVSKDLFWTRQKIEDLTEDEANFYIDKLEKAIEEYSK